MIRLRRIQFIHMIYASLQSRKSWFHGRSKFIDSNLTVSTAPHSRGNITTRRIMWGVIAALLPIMLASIYFFRWPAVKLIAVCVGGCIITEIIFQKLRGKKLSISDGSVVITGLLLAFILPPNLPLGVALLGAVVSIGLGKQIFGGLGLNIFNPALVGRAFLMAAFPALLTRWVEPYTLDAITKATPLGLMKFKGIATPFSDLFLGSTSGSLGETCALAIILGGGYLLIKRYIDWRIPLSIMIAVAISAGTFWLIDSAKYPSPLFHLFAGGLMLGAFFMATDPVASPMTKKGRWIFGIGIGILVVVIRLFGGLPEGVMYAILIMEAAVPLINRISRPRVFGAKK